MKRSEAEKHLEFIKKYCRENGIWFDESKVNRPKLGKIRLEIDMKVDSDD